MSQSERQKSYVKVDPKLDTKVGLGKFEQAKGDSARDKETLDYKIKSGKGTDKRDN